MNKIYIVGAGPGDPELITVKGQRVVSEADVIIYTGSLVPKEVLSHSKEGAELYNSASMNLDEVIERIQISYKENKKIVRLHTGDPTIYGAIREQIDALDKLEIPCEVVPGVSSFTAAAAVMKKELTLPDVSQTIICTRISGRTKVDEKENLASLASHKATMAIFLSVDRIEDVCKELATHYPIDTPVAVVQRATWPEQKVVVGNLETIAAKVKEAGIDKTAQILVGNFLGNEYSLSKLYDKEFAHGYRESK